MQIISHRGYWKDPAEKNTEVAFTRSFELGFGTETDIRDFNGSLVISHDPVEAESPMPAQRFFELYCSIDHDLPLALNIKADGLQAKLMALINQFNLTKYFVFDMSVPDGLQYIKHGFHVFTRLSEYELQPSFIDKSAGVWLDQFHSPWFTQETLAPLIAEGKQICIVSPDLHGRAYEQEWERYKTFDREFSGSNLTLCTDHPEKARDFFND